MREILNSCNTKDSRGRENPSAFLARITQVVSEAGRDLVAIRRRQMRGIRGHVVQDRNIIKAQIQACGQPFKDFYEETVRGVADENSPIQHFLKAKDRLDIAGLEADVKGRLEQMDAIKIQPFLTVAGEFKEAAGKFLKLIEDGRARGHASKKELTKAYVEIFIVCKNEQILRLLKLLNYKLSFTSALAMNLSAEEELKRIFDLITSWPADFVPYLEEGPNTGKHNQYLILVAKLTATFRENGLTALKKELKKGVAEI